MLAETLHDPSVNASPRVDPRHLARERCEPEKERDKRQRDLEAASQHFPALAIPAIRIGIKNAIGFFRDGHARVPQDPTDGRGWPMQRNV
ncbi:hypothetical protein [Hyphomicrobium facile]|uniref:hypothetical protein n=1 Tax=Hyphomicrobium facile TaxID=51670 RepID=UPI0015A60990|nr:hypothetical protein [Hyphomicrobium facile]